MIFYIMGKSASGKDKIYGILSQNPALALKKIILYTTRPIREKETDGVQYHFVTPEVLEDFRKQGKVIEQRDYQTVAGVWSYATIDDGSVKLEKKSAAAGNESLAKDEKSFVSENSDESEKLLEAENSTETLSIPTSENYIAIGTLDSYRKIRDYYGADNIFPIYIEVEDGERLARALKREKKQAVPNYQELCRRFLADCEDFSEENIRSAGISRRFDNTGELEVCLKEVEEAITSVL